MYLSSNVDEQSLVKTCSLMLEYVFLPFALPLLIVIKRLSVKSISDNMKGIEVYEGGSEYILISIISLVLFTVRVYSDGGNDIGSEIIKMSKVNYLAILIAVIFIQLIILYYIIHKRKIWKVNKDIRYYTVPTATTYVYQLFIIHSILYFENIYKYHFVIAIIEFLLIVISMLFIYKLIDSFEIPHALNVRATELLQLSLYPKAIKKYKHILLICREPGVVYNARMGLVNCYVKNNQKKNAIKQLNKILKMNISNHLKDQVYTYIHNIK